MKIKFLGTKGQSEPGNPDYREDSGVLITIDKTKYLFDFGASHKGKFKQINPHFVFLTHAHPGNVGGLEGEAITEPVYLSEATNKLLDETKYPMKDRKVFAGNKMIYLRDLKMIPIPLVHSIEAPTHGFVILSEGRKIGYFPDVLILPKKKDVLSDMDLLITNGTTISNDVVQTLENKKTGHASMKKILTWAREASVKRVIFSHLGKETLRIGEEQILRALRVRTA